MLIKVESMYKVVRNYKYGRLWRFRVNGVFVHTGLSVISRGFMVYFGAVPVCKLCLP